MTVQRENRSLRRGKERTSSGQAKPPPSGGLGPGRAAGEVGRLPRGGLVLTGGCASVTCTSSKLAGTLAGTRERGLVGASMCARTWVLPPAANLAAPCCLRSCLLKTGWALFECSLISQPFLQLLLQLPVTLRSFPPRTSEGRRKFLQVGLSQRQGGSLGWLITVCWCVSNLGAWIV